jgi:hypothetical protein
VRHDLDRRIVRLRFYRTLAGAALFVLSIPIALWQPVAAEVVWSVFMVGIFVFLRGNRGTTPVSSASQPGR